MRLEPREQPSLLLSIFAPALAVAASLALCATLLVWSGAPVFEAYALLVKGAVGSHFALTETLSRATPLILTGLAAAVAFRAKLWNIGGEGQLYAGALAATALGSGLIVLPTFLMIPLLMVGGAVAGALLLLGPVILKTRFGVDEVVTTLLLNFVVLLFVGLLLEGPLQDPNSYGWPQASPIIAEGRFPKFIARTRLHWGLGTAVIAAFVIWFVNTRSTWGFEMKATGANVDAARFAGVKIERVMLRVALFSGGLAGLAGVSEVAGLKGYLTLDLSSGFGYTGIVVAMLAQLHPLGVIAAAVFIAIIFVGADFMGRSVGVSSYLAHVIVATSLICMLVAILFTQFRFRRG